jgi:hypothetical protein
MAVRRIMDIGGNRGMWLEHDPCPEIPLTKTMDLYSAVWEEQRAVVVNLRRRVKSEVRLSVPARSEHSRG